MFVADNIQIPFKIARNVTDVLLAQNLYIYFLLHSLFPQLFNYNLTGKRKKFKVYSSTFYSSLNYVSSIWIKTQNIPRMSDFVMPLLSLCSEGKNSPIFQQQINFSYFSNNINEVTIYSVVCETSLCCVYPFTWLCSVLLYQHIIIIFFYA